MAPREFAFVELTKGCYRREPVEVAGPAKTDDEDAVLRAKRRREFEVAMRQSVMEFDAADLDRNRSLNFREFSELVRNREMGIHSEDALRARFNELDADGSGTLEMDEFIKFSLRDALSRCAAMVTDLLAEWDEDGNGEVDVEEFRKVVRHFGFEAKNDEIDAVFHDFDTDGGGTLSLEELATQLGLRDLPFGMQQRALRKQSWRGDKMTEESLKSLGDDLRRSLEKAEAGDDKPDTSNDSPMLAKMRQRREFELRIDRLIAFLGSHVGRVMDLFRIMDQDGDGLIQKKELKVFLEAIGFKVTHKEVSYVFAKLDKDGGGTIDFKELNRTLQRAPAAPGMEKEERAGAKKRDPTQIKCTGAILKTLKGKVTEGSDICVQLAAALAANWSKVTTLFRECDADGDGILSQQELRSALGLEGIGIARHAVDELFSKIDKDQSGEISLKEFANAIRPAATIMKGASQRLAAASRLSEGGSVASLLPSPSLTRMQPRQRCMSPAPRYPRTPVSMMQLPPLERGSAPAQDMDPFPPPTTYEAMVPPGSALSTLSGPLGVAHPALLSPPPRSTDWSVSPPSRPWLPSTPPPQQRSAFARPSSPQRPPLQLSGLGFRPPPSKPWDGFISPPGTPAARVSRRAEDAWWLSWLGRQSSRPPPGIMIRGSQSTPVMKQAGLLAPGPGSRGAASTTPPEKVGPPPVPIQPVPVPVTAVPQSLYHNQSTLTDPTSRERKPVLA